MLSAADNELSDNWTQLNLDHIHHVRENIAAAKPQVLQRAIIHVKLDSYYLFDDIQFVDM